MQLYNMLPSPPQVGAPVDMLLNAVNPASAAMGALKSSSAGKLLQSILAGLSRQPAMAKEPVYDQFGSPVESSLHTSFNKKTGEFQQYRIDPEPEYPPPGLSDEETVQWALNHPPPEYNRLPEEGSGETVVMKVSPPPKKKKVTEVPAWKTIVQGLNQ